MLGWLPVRDGAQAERVGHRAVSFWLHLLAWWHQKNLKLILWKTTTALLIGMALVGWAFYSFFTVMLHLLQGLHQQKKSSVASLSSQRASQGEEPGETLSPPCTYGSSSHPCRPGSPAGRRTASSWGCTCAAAGTRTRTCCSVPGAPERWPSRWVLHTAASEETTQGMARPDCRCHQEGPKPVPRSRLH